MPWLRTARLVGEPGSPAAARAFVAATLATLYRNPHDIEATCDDTVIIASELVTNAVQSASPAVEIALHVERGHLMLAVSDHAGGTPMVTGRAAGDQTHGRGLAIVASLSSDWGISPRADAGPGKTVWARLLLPVAPDAWD